MTITLAALVVGCYLLVKHWDAIKAAVMNSAAFKAAADVVKWLAGVFSSAWDSIVAGWNSFIALLTGFSPSKALSGMASGIVTLFDNIWQTIKGGFLKSWNWIVGKLNKIPGVDIELSPVVNPVNPKVAGGVMPPVMQNNYAGNIQQSLTANTLSTGGQLKGVDRGGISNTISKNSKSVTDNSQNINELHVHTTEPFTPGLLMEWQELN